MKYSLVLVISFAFVFSYGQDSIPAFDAIDYTQYRNHFYFNPISPLLQSFEVGFERMDDNFTNSFAIFTGVSYRDQADNFGGNNDQQYLGLKLNVQYRFGIVNQPKARIRRNQKITQQNLFVYLSPYVTAKYGSNNSRTDQFLPDPNNPNGPFILQTITTKRQGGAFAGGVAVGGRWTFGKRFDMDVFLGGGFQYSTSNQRLNIFLNDQFDVYRVFYSGIVPTLGYSLGISF